MKKSDIIIALVTGEIVALFFINLFKELLAKGGVISLVFYSLPIVFPILAVVCLWIAYLMGKTFLFIYQLAKFLLIGALATVFDLGTLSLFLALTGVSSGAAYAVFKGISFIVATVAKYFADKFWAFEKKETENAGKEFGKFFIVTLIGFVVNVGIAYGVVTFVKPMFGLTPENWGIIGGVVATLVTFAWNFIGYKFIVFKK